MTTQATWDRLAKFPEENSLLIEKLKAPLPMIVVHRGAKSASIAENTSKAIHTANLLGADIVETDVIRSTDGKYFLFHDGTEEQHFGLNRNIRELSSAEISKLSYSWHSAPDKKFYGVEPLESLKNFPNTIFNIDRSWDYWPHLFEELETFDMTQQLLLKSQVGQEELNALVKSKVKFPYLAIVKTMAEVNAVMAYPEINTVGFELLAHKDDDEFADKATIMRLKEMGYLIQLNALNLINRENLYLGWDDEESLLSSPQSGWGKLIDQGADIVQTDWPSLLRDFRTSRVEN
ncbi:glycerophosphoryl diester phosphodiesterase [Corynebacterium glutamicum]|uniref:glycerophosphodiester phosphodiesterase family protein n=1 Tax=Corynebacterium glutamicum TaxID=1718 RepID=UPI00097AA89D|nr:glycerophosphodiester phosphodiesterase family protein [Corynebacterium glutamicum]GAV98041.1 glycerophosphoryl diester phosphodiesterase [Corynebacterium glutamicum]